MRPTADARLGAGIALSALNYKRMNELSKEAVARLSVDENSAGQRIDNFLARLLKGVPKSHVYRILRSGEVRLNGKRVGPDARLAAGDTVRVPPIRTATQSSRAHAAPGVCSVHGEVVSWVVARVPSRQSAGTAPSGRLCKKNKTPPPARGTTVAHRARHGRRARNPPSL